MTTDRDNDEQPRTRRRRTALHAAIGTDRSPSQPEYVAEITGRRIVYANLRLDDAGLTLTMTPDGEFRLTALRRDGVPETIFQGNACREAERPSTRHDGGTVPSLT